MTDPSPTAPSRASCRAAPGFRRPSALRVFDLSLGEMLWSRRTIFMAARGRRAGR